jgi:lipoate-protein ligase A
MIWRLILDESASGAWNMATDEALLLSQSPGDAPVLRFYDWNPPCISIGRFQRVRNDHSALAIPHSTFVRRPTGGRAIWHQHEITYSVVLREELLPRETRSVLGSYQWLSRALIQGLQTLGVESQLATSDERLPRGEKPVNCFASSARSDFMVQGRKLIGAAQCRKNGAILQHGSLLLKVDANAWERAVGGSMAATISLEELGITASRPSIIAALRQGVQQALDAQLQESQVSEIEKERAARLYSQKYTIDKWNLDGLEP